MASSESKLPIDTTVKIPPSVVAAAAAADAAHKAAYTPPEPDPAVPAISPQPDPPPVDTATKVTAPATAPAAPVQRPSVPETGETGSWEHRFHAMKGRYDQASHTIGSMQEQMAELGDELVRTQSLIRMNPQERNASDGQRQPGQAPRRFVNDEDVKTYGPELIDFVQRAAREALGPDINQTQNQVRQVSQRVGQVTQADMLTSLEREVPNWKQINLDDRFKSWCRLPDVYSNQIRGKLLNAAFQAADAPRVVAFFKGFLAEGQATGQLPDPAQQQQPSAAPRQAAVALESLAAPGRPKPAGGDTSAASADKPVFTRAQITAFYNAVRTGAYLGRDADKLKDEQAIFAAQREGRVR